MPGIERVHVLWEDSPSPQSAEVVYLGRTIYGGYTILKKIWMEKEKVDKIVGSGKDYELKVWGD